MVRENPSAASAFGISLHHATKTSGQIMTAPILAVVREWETMTLRELDADKRLQFLPSRRGTVSRVWICERVPTVADPREVLRDVPVKLRQGVPARGAAQRNRPTPAESVLEAASRHRIGPEFHIAPP